MLGCFKERDSTRRSYLGHTDTSFRCHEDSVRIEVDV